MDQEGREWVVLWLTCMAILTIVVMGIDAL
jgi:hypothetical protein